jgi:CBS domain containing-hemolysin-like protein
MDLIISSIGLILSFIFAGSETAYISTNPIRVELWIRKEIKSANLAKEYFQKPELYLSTTLVGNNLANVLTTSYATVYLITFWEETLAWFVITLTILLFGEIVPKVLFRTYANAIILKVLYVIRIFHFLLNPLILFASYVSTAILRIFNISDTSDNTIFDKNEIMVLVNEAIAAGIVDREEQKIISRVLTLPDTLVREAMVPRTAIEAIEENSAREELIELITKTGKTKIPVYKGNIDNITGVIFFFDLLQQDKKLKELIRPVNYVPENKKCNILLKEFQKANISIAIVVDEYGGTAGIVTFEDLVEELFGEFDESDRHVSEPLVRQNQNTWRIQGEVEIDVINEQLKIHIPEGDYETIAGFVIARLGRIPDTGEKIILKDCTVVVSNSTPTKVTQVRLIKKS